MSLLVGPVAFLFDASVVVRAGVSGARPASAPGGWTARILSCSLKNAASSLL